MSALFEELGAKALDRLLELADNVETQEKNRIEVYKWMCEMAYGKPGARGDGETAVPGEIILRFEGVLDDWSR